MGTSRIVSFKDLQTRELNLPKSWKSGSTEPDLNGVSAAGMPGGATDGLVTGYDETAYLQTPTASGRACSPITLPGKWHLFDSDMERTAHSAGVLLNPLSANMTAIIPIKLGIAHRVIFAAKSQATAHTTSPVIAPWLIWGEWDTVNQRFYGVEGIMRADADTAAATGQTLTLPAVAASATMADSWLFGNPIPDRYGYDTKGAPYMIVLRQTAGVVTGGGNLLQGICLLTN